MSFDVRIRNGRGSVLVAECFRRDTRPVAHLLISLTNAHAHGGIQSQCAVSGKACRIRQYGANIIQLRGFTLIRAAAMAFPTRSSGLCGARKGLLKTACHASVVRMTPHDKLFAETCVFFHFRGFETLAIYE